MDFKNGWVRLGNNLFKVSDVIMVTRDPPQHGREDIDVTIKLRGGEIMHLNFNEVEINIIISAIFDLLSENN